MLLPNPVDFHYQLFQTFSGPVTQVKTQSMAGAGENTWVHPTQRQYAGLLYTFLSHRFESLKQHPELYVIREGFLQSFLLWQNIHNIKITIFTVCK